MTVCPHHFLNILKWESNNQLCLALIIYSYKPVACNIQLVVLPVDMASHQELHLLYKI